MEPWEMCVVKAKRKEEEQSISETMDFQATIKWDREMRRETTRE